MHFSLALAQFSAAAALQVVYPAPQHETTTEQIFLIGTAPVQGTVTVNGQPIRRSPRGHFAQSFPLTPGKNTFTLEFTAPQATAQTQTIVVTRVSSQPEPPNQLAFVADSLYPNFLVSRLPGEPICFEAIAPVGATVTASLAGKMTPLQPEEGVLSADKFGILAGRIEAARSSGRYRGCTTIVGSGKPSYELRWQDKTLTQSATGTIERLDPERLPIVEVTAPFGVTRTGSTTDFARLTPLPKGTQAQVTGQDGDWWRLNYGAGNQVWMKRSETQVLRQSSVPLRSSIRGVTSQTDASWTEVRFPLEHPMPFTITQRDRTLSLTLHNTVSQSDIIKLVQNPAIDRITWQQLNPDTLNYTLHFKTQHQWGYKTRYEGNKLILSVKNPPTPRTLAQPLAGRTILLDAGHGGPDDAGARGPGGIPEKDVTLVVTKQLRDRLVAKGAKVIMTREADVDLGPNERAAMVNQSEPDLALSLHYNALPDNGNAEKTKGISVFWFHDQAQPFAQFMHDHLTQSLKRSSDGVFWNNLAVTRPHVAPSVLLELGYMIHPEEYEWIINPQEQARLTESLAIGIETWFKTVR